MTTTAAPLAPAEPTPATSAATNTQATAPRGHLGRIVTLTIGGGALAAVAAVAGPFSLSPASTVVSVQDTGHTIQLDQPALVIEAVARLLEATP